MLSFFFFIEEVKFYSLKHTQQTTTTMNIYSNGLATIKTLFIPVCFLVSAHHDILSVK